MPDTLTEPLASPGTSLVDRLVAGLRAQERTILLGTVAFQALILVVMIASRELVLLRGETLWLRVVPVDPRDLFRGDYVILGYDFSRMGPAGAVPGQTVYVTHEPEANGQHWRAVDVSTQRPSRGKFIQGMVQGGRIECGIESFFVQEGRGRRYEDAIRAGRLYAEIAVDADGRAVVRRLRVE
jgi:uncharacterized membrane-anchored protein